MPIYSNCVGYSNNEKNENNSFSYNLMLKNIPYHIKGGLKRTLIMPGALNNIQTALQENIGDTCSKHMLKLGFIYKKNQTSLKLLIEVTSSSAESNIYGRFVISQ